jgi:small subunit ribosomal protein S7
MPRRKRSYKRDLKPDSKFGSVLVSKIINNLMERGKKTVAEKIVYDCLELIHQKTKKGGLNLFEQAIKNVSPLVELKSRRVGGANYQIPIPVIGERRTTLAIRWIKIAAQAKKGKSLAEKLAEEIIEAANNTGAAIKKRDDVKKMAEANKAFAHFA